MHARSLAAGLLALAALLVAPGAAFADTIFSDGFESSDFHNWSSVVTGGDGKAVVQTAIVSTGELAAQLSESSASASKAYIRKTFAASQTELTATGDFDVIQEGASGGNVPLFRLLDPSSARILNVYRQNATNGQIWIGWGSTHVKTSGSLPLNTWGTLSVHAITNGAASTVDVTLNNNSILHITNASLGTAGVSTIQLGNDSAAQVFNLAADTISVDSAASTATAPVNTLPPDISGTPQSGQTMTASTGTWSGQPSGYTYQWQRCGASGGSCQNITGAAGRTYAVTDADVGSTLRVAVTATNSVGSTTAFSTVSTVVQSASAPPVNTSPPMISGTAVVGQTLNVSQGAWSGTQPMTFAQQWRRCDSTGAGCTDIAGATGASYTITADDVSDTLRVVVTATNTIGTGSAASNATAVVSGSSNQANLVALWHMDETSGTVMHDATGNGHDGTIFNAKLGVPGWTGSAYAFTGTNSYVSVPSASDLNPGNSNIAITMHLNTTSVPASPDWDLIRKGLYSTGSEFKMEWQPDGRASCGFEGTSNYGELFGGPRIDDGRWHTVQCIKTSSAIQLVVDGQVTSQTITIGSISNTVDVPIGARPASEFFKGSLDEASIQVG